MIMKKYLFLIAVALLVLATDCVNEIDTFSEINKTRNVVFTATRESDPLTKVELSGKNMLWSPGDIIGVFPASDWDADYGYQFQTARSWRCSYLHLQLQAVWNWLLRQYNYLDCVGIFFCHSRIYVMENTTKRCQIWWGHSRIHVMENRDAQLI